MFYRSFIDLVYFYQTLGRDREQYVLEESLRIFYNGYKDIILF